MLKISKRAKAIVIAFLLFVSIVLSETLTFAEAEETTEISFKESNVIDDLESANFDFSKYPVSTSSPPKIVSVIEYCYSYYADMRDNYGLYIIIANPANINFRFTSSQNKIQMATHYNSAGDPDNYEKYNLIPICSDTKNSVSYYKFLVSDHITSYGQSLLSRVSPDCRRYDISGIELHVDGNSSATDYEVGGSYQFTGYSKGYGPDETTDSTLNCTISEFETITLDLNHTYWRSATSVKGEGHQNQVNTCYFTVPGRFFDEYGTLQRIKAEWYEYRTKDIIVVQDIDVYDTLYMNLGFLVTTYNVGKNGEPINLSLYENGFFHTEVLNGITYDWAWNGLSKSVVSDKEQNESTLHYVFYIDNVSSFDPSNYNKSLLGGSELHSWILGTVPSGGSLPVKNGTVSADLFQDDIDESRKITNERGVIQKGYSYYDFDATLDLQTWESFEDGDPSFWERIDHYGFWDTLFGQYKNEIESGKKISPIHIVDASDFSNSDNSIIAENLTVNVNDVETLKAKSAACSSNGDKLVLFRFATTDYFSKMLGVHTFSDSHKDDYHNEQNWFCSECYYSEDTAYRAQQTVFLDFDIIQLTFNDEGTYTVIPVVASPIDIVADITPPIVNEDGDFLQDPPDWMENLINAVKTILAIVAGIIILVLLWPLIWPVIRLIFKGIVWLIAFPFNLLGKAMKARRGTKDNEQKKK